MNMPLRWVKFRTRRLATTPQARNISDYGWNLIFRGEWNFCCAAASTSMHANVHRSELAPPKWRWNATGFRPFNFRASGAGTPAFVSGDEYANGRSLWLRLSSPRLHLSLHPASAALARGDHHRRVGCGDLFRRYAIWREVPGRHLVEGPYRRQRKWRRRLDR